MEFIIEDGILHNVEKILPDETEIEIPVGVTEIAPYCFCWNETIHRVTLPEGLLKIGEGAFQSCENLEWINLPDSICEIGSYAFYETAITSIVIPGNLSVVPANCFERCSELRSVELRKGILVIEEMAFAKCISLENISIPDGLISIGCDVFKNCVFLKTIRIPDTVQSIGEGTFDGCTSLLDPQKLFGNYINPDIIISKASHITLKSVYSGFPYRIGCGSIVGNPYLQSITVSGNVESGAIKDCPNLEVVYADSNTYLGREAFVNCPKLKYVVVPQPEGEWHWPEDCPRDYYSQELDGFKFDYGAFGKDIQPLFCPEYPLKQEYSKGFYLYKAFPNTTEYILPDRIRRIGKYAFKGCDSIRSITLHGHVEFIGDFAFANLENLETLKLEHGIQKIGNSPNEPNDVYKLRWSSELPHSDYTFFGCKKLKTVELPDTLTHICSYAFAQCASLERIHLPENMNRLYIHVFENCTALKEIIFPKRLNRIGVGAFMGCSSLTNISIPDSVTRIDAEAFSGCSGLTRVQLPNSLVMLERGAFSDCENLIEILPPQGSRRIKVINGLLYEDNNLNTCPAGLDEAIIEPGTSVIQSYAFHGCRKLRSVVIPEGVTDIQGLAFWGCDNLEEVILPNSLTRLCTWAFKDCPKLKPLVLPPNVKEYI